MDLTNQLRQIEQQLEQYEEATDPEERMDLKQTITQAITHVRLQAQKLDSMDKKVALGQLEEFEEILSY